MLTCRALAAQLLDFVDKNLGADSRRAALRHVAGCGGCAAALANYRTTVDLVRAAYESSSGLRDEAPVPEELVQSILSSVRTASDDGGG
ncbi:MAG: zf-HC2 domain-containing protein [Acidobacteriota bacterium]